MMKNGGFTYFVVDVQTWWPSEVSTVVPTCTPYSTPAEIFSRLIKHYELYVQDSKSSAAEQHSASYLQDR